MPSSPVSFRELQKPEAQFPRIPDARSPVSENFSSRNCLENPHGLHLEVPEVGKTRGEAPSLPLCTTKNTCSRPVKLFSKQFLEGKFSETHRLCGHKKRARV